MTTEQGTVRRIVALAVVMTAAAVGGLLLLPSVSAPRRSSDWWVVPLLAGAYALAERTVFHFEFRREAISFSISEVPTVFALLYVGAGPAVAARVLGSLVIIVLKWRSPLYKLFFNGALFALELAIAYLIVEGMTDQWGTAPTAVLGSLALAVAVATVTGSVLVSAAIACVEGKFLERLTGELKVTGWFGPVNALVAAAVVAPTLLSPWLIVLAAVPLVAFWAVMRANGNLAQRLRDLDDIHGFVRHVSPALEIDELSSIVVTEASSRLRTKRAAMVVFDDANGARRRDVGVPIPQLPHGVDEPRWGSLLDDGARMVSAEVALAHGLDELAALGDFLVAPISDGSELMGLVVLAEREGAESHFRAADAARLGTMVDQVAPSLRKAMFHERIEFEARHDALTLLPNRSLFERSLDQRLAAGPVVAGEHTAVMLMDLDRFKEVNDTLGHHAGDQLLVDFALRLRTQLREDDVLSRLAGDEFAVLATRSDDGLDGLDELARRLVSEAHRPFSIDGLEVVVTVSVGVAEVDETVTDAVTMLRRADIAMYTAKHHHSGYEVYRPEIDRRTPQRLSMLGDLRSALERHELTVHLQPKVDLGTGLVVGVEALSRWYHPGRGNVSPEDFIRLAEETGLIKQLTDSVLESSIEQIGRLGRAGHHLGLAVNISAHDLLDELLADRVLRRLDQYGVDASTLTLEITESSLLVDAPRTRATIDRLHQAGIRLSVDDFGTGYSSLTYLRHLPISELKIDQSFVMNLPYADQDEKIVRSIIDLGHSLGMRVVAEGVETEDIMNRLRGFGCDVAQGFGISRPVSYDDLLAWLGAPVARYVSHR